MKDNHDETMGAIANVRVLLERNTVLTKSANDGVVRINGSIAKMQTDIGKNTLDINTIITEYKNAFEENYKFQREQRDEIKKGKDWRYIIKNNPIIFLATVLVGAGAGSYLPIIWMFVKKFLKNKN